MYVCIHDIYIYIYIYSRRRRRGAGQGPPACRPSAGDNNDNSIPFQLPYHPKVALAGRLINGLGTTLACAPSGLCTQIIVAVVHIPISKE